MSATNRGAERHKDDFYRTPSWATDAVLPHLPLSGRVLEPSAGDGGIVARLLLAGVQREDVLGYEIDQERAAACAGLGVAVRIADFLQAVPEQVALVVTNPPYRLAQEFIDAALRWVEASGGTVAMLLRVNFLGGQKRASFHRAKPADIYVLPRRPSFTGSGTDACEYAWMVWSPTRGNRWHILDVDSARSVQTSPARPLAAAPPLQPTLDVVEADAPAGNVSHRTLSMNASPLDMVAVQAAGSLVVADTRGPAAPLASTIGNVNEGPSATRAVPCLRGSLEIIVDMTVKIAALFGGQTLVTAPEELEAPIRRFCQRVAVWEAEGRPLGALLSVEVAMDRAVDAHRALVSSGFLEVDQATGLYLDSVERTQLRRLDLGSRVVPIFVGRQPDESGSASMPGQQVDDAVDGYLPRSK